MGRFNWLLASFLGLPGIMCGQDKPDTNILNRIRSEAFQHSEVMDISFYLTDVTGPRLTGSPAFNAAGEWVIRRLKEYNIDQVHKENLSWGRSWSYKRSGFYLEEPYTATLVASPAPWSSATKGIVKGQPFLAPAPGDVLEDSYRKYVQANKGKLKGKFVLVTPPAPVKPQLNPPFRRFTDEELVRLSKAPVQVGQVLSDSIINEFHKWGMKLNQFFLDEKVAGLVYQSRSDAGMVVSYGPYWARETKAKIPPLFFLAAEYYNQVLRLMEQKIPVTLSAELDASYHNDGAAAFNIIGEIPGSTRKEEVIMIGAHLDSWTGANGATDDAAGCAIVMEVMRILRSVGVKPQRTIRMVLWGGHEGAGLGSATYVKQHYGDSVNKRADHNNLIAYFNLDNGGGRIRGIYLPEKYSFLQPAFHEWLAALKDSAATTIIPIGNPSGSDHENFFNAGLPGFMFIQDPLDYRTLTRHSNLDLYDRLQPGDMKQAAAFLAAFIYQAAMSDRLFREGKQ